MNLGTLGMLLLSTESLSHMIGPEQLTWHRKYKEVGDIPHTAGALIPGELRRPFWNGREENPTQMSPCGVFYIHLCL